MSNVRWKWRTKDGRIGHVTGMPSDLRAFMSKLEQNVTAIFGSRDGRRGPTSNIVGETDCGLTYDELRNCHELPTGIVEVDMYVRNTPTTPSGGKVRTLELLSTNEEAVEHGPPVDFPNGEFAAPAPNYGGQFTGNGPTRNFIESKVRRLDLPVTNDDEPHVTANNQARSLQPLSTAE